MSLTTRKSKDSKPIAITADKKFIYLNNDDDNSDSDDSSDEKEIKLKKKILPFFDVSKKGVRIFLSGSTGSGKSYLCEKVIETSFKNTKQIYLFSSVYDGDYDKFAKKLLHIDLEQFYGENTDCKDIYSMLMPNSLCIFDDILSYSDNKPYLKLRSQVLATGRHKNISCIVIEQQAMNRNLTREVLLNCEIYIFFPNSSFRSFKKCSEEYLGLTNKQIEELKSKKSRWLAINKVYPMYVVSEKSVEII